jgi:enoyl-CoA hydratase/carnithine racemase
MGDARVHLSHDDGLTELSMDYAPVNQFNAGFLQEILDAVNTLGPETRALVVYSSVPKMFAAGGDIPWMAAAELGEALEFVALCQETYTSFEQVHCPAVAAIDGHCLGGGLELSLACDIRVAGRSARLGLPETQIGLIAGAGGTQRLVRAIGQGLARDMLLTGRRISGAEAADFGIVSRLVDDGDALATARAIGRQLADGPAEAIQATKRLAVAASELTITTGLDRERAEWAQLRPSASSQEGLSAFAEKRKPDFAAARASEAAGSGQPA